MIPANEAKKRTAESTKRAEWVLKQIEETIKKQADNGHNSLKFSLTAYNDKISFEVLQALKNAGYDYVKNEDNYEITW